MAFIRTYACINDVHMHTCMYQLRPHAYMHVSMAFIRTYVCVNGVHTHICMCQWRSYAHRYVSMAFVYIHIHVNCVRMRVCMCQWSTYAYMYVSMAFSAAACNRWVHGWGRQCVCVYTCVCMSKGIYQWVGM